MSYAQLRADVTLDTRALENSLQFADNMMRAFTRGNYTSRVALDTKVFEQQASNVKRVMATMGQVSVPVTMDVRVNGQAVAIQSLNAIEKQVANASKAAETAGAKIAVVHRNIEGMSGTTKLDFNGAKLMQGLEQASARVLKFKQDFGSGAGIGDITGQINKLQTFFSGQGIKADAFNKVIPELQRVLEMQQHIKGNRIIDFEIKVNQKGVAEIGKLNVAIDGAKMKTAALAEASGDLKRFDHNIAAAAKNSNLIGKAMDANAAKTTKAAQGMVSSFDSVGRSILKTAKAEDALSRSSSSASSWAGKLRDNIIGTAGGILVYQGLNRAAQGFTGTIKAGLDHNDRLAKANLTFTAQLDGNSQAARRLIGELEKLASQTPFEFKDLLPLTAKLNDAGRSAKTVVADIRNIGDYVARIGEGKEFIDRIVYALNQMNTAGKVTGNELRQMSEARVPGIKLLAEGFGTTTAAMQKMVTDGIVPSDKAINILITGMGREGFGFMAKQSKTLTGALSNLADIANQTAGKAFEGLYNRLARNVVIIGEFAQNRNLQLWFAQTQISIETMLDRLKVVGSFLFDLGKIALPFVGAALVGVGLNFARVGAVAALAFASTIPAAITSGMAALSRFIVLSRTASVTFAYVPAIILVGVTAAVKGFFLLGDALNNLLDKMPQKAKDFIGFKASDFKDFQADFDRGLDFVVQAGKKKLGALVFNFLPDTSLLSKAWSEAGNTAAKSFGGGAAPKLPKYTTADLLTGKGADAGRKADAAARKAEAAASRAAAAARKMEADRLGDLATSYGNLASAAEKSAARQIAAMQSLKEGFGGLFGDAQNTLLGMGVTSNPLGGLIGGLEKILDLGEKSAKIVADARQKFGTFQGAANDARSRREQLQGLDGVIATKSGALVGGSAAGDRIAVAAVQMQRFTADYRKRCDALADITVNSATKMFSGIMGARKGDTAARTMARFMGAGIGFKPNGAYQAGDIVYTGASKKQSAGHVQIVGPNGNFLDQYGSHTRPTTAPQWVVRAGGAAQAQRFTPPAIGTKSAGQKKAGFDASGFDIQAITGDLTTIQAVDKGFGAAVRNLEGNAARFAIQSKLATQEGRAMLNALARAIKEPGFQKVLDELKGRLGTAFTLRGKGTHAEAGLMRDIGNAIDTQLNAPARAAKIEEASKSLAKLKSGLSDSAFLLREQGKAWRENANDAAKAEKQNAITAERLRLWREDTPVTQLFKQGDKKGANAAFSQLMGGFVGVFDTQKGVEKIKETNAQIAEQIKLRAENHARMIEEGVETRRAALASVEAQNAQNAALRLEISLRGQGLNETAINNALELRRVFLDKYTVSIKKYIAAFAAQGSSPMMALALGMNAASADAAQAVNATKAGHDSNATNDRSKELSEAQNQLAQRRFELENHIGEAAKRQFDWKMKGLPVDEKVLAVLRQIDAIPFQDWMRKTQAEGALNRQLNNPLLTQQQRGDLQFRADKRDAFTPEQIDLMLPIDQTMRRMQEQSEVFGSIMTDWKSTWNSTWQEIGKTGNFSLGSMLDSMSARLVAFGAETLSNKAWDMLLGLFTNAAVGAVGAPGTGVNLRPSGESSGVNLRPTGGPSGVNLRPSASFAVGIDRVPRDMTARLHANEMVLNSAESDRYRSQQIALELVRGQSRQQAAQSAGSVTREGDTINLTINAPGAKDGKKLAQDAHSELARLSRRSNAKNLQQATSTGF